MINLIKGPYFVGFLEAKFFWEFWGWIKTLNSRDYHVN